MKAMGNRIQDICEVRLLLTLLIFIPVLGFAQTKEQESEMVTIRNQATFLHAEAEGETAEQAKKNAVKALMDAVMTEFGSALPNTIDRSSLEAEAASAMSQSKVSFNPELVEWERRRTFYAFAYISKINAQRFLATKVTQAFRDVSKFTFADAYADDQQTAVSNAQSALIQQFQVTVDASQSLTETETNNEYNSAFQSQTKAFSRMSLIGLKQLTFTVGEQSYAFVYISHEDKEESFLVAKNKVISLVQEGAKQEGYGNFSRAAKNYYIGYILADTYYKPIDYTFEDGSKTNNLKQALKSKVEDYLQTVDIEVKPAYEIAEQNIAAPFVAKRGSDRMNGVVYQYSVQGYDYVNTINYGRGKFEFTDYYPVERIEVFPVRFIFDLQEEMAANPTLAELEPDRKFFIVRPIEVDFSNVFKVTIEAYFNGIDVTFSLHTRNVSAFTAKWEFGDGFEEIGLNPTHTYNELKQFPVKVTVNGDNFLTDTKIVDLEEGVLKSGAQRLMAAVAPPRVTPIQVPAPMKEVELKDTTTVPEPVVEEAEEVAEQDSVIAIPEPEVQQDTVVTVPEPEPVAEEPVAMEKPEELAPDLFQSLMKYKSFTGLMRVLQAKQKQGELEFAGKQSDLFDSSGALVIVADQKRVYDHMLFVSNRYIKLSNGEEIVNLAEKYSGKYMIWVQKN